jgi:isoquinoline 1-oxidoreductase alpha subunit
MMTLEVNGKIHEISSSPDTPLLWVLRDELKLTGTKFGCGEGICGSCTVLVGDNPTRSCVTAVKEMAGKKITTIEGLPEDHPVKRAWLEVEVSQCGYCQPGQILTAASLLKKSSNPDDGEIDTAMDDNLCRCGTYPRIRAGIHLAASIAKGGAK